MALICDEIYRRVMAGALLIYLTRCDVGNGLLDLHGNAVFFRSGDPLIHVAWLRHGQFGILARCGKRARRFADDCLQGVLPDLEIAFGSDLLSDGQVVAGLCFMGVGDGRGADLEILLGRFQLLDDGRLVGTHGLQVFDSINCIEIGLRHAQDQILASLHKVGFGLRHLHFRLVVGNPVLPAEQRLRERELVAVGVVLRF